MSIQTFKVDIPQQAIDDLHARLAHVRWPGEFPGMGWRRGVPVDYLKDLVNYWQNTYDWREQERNLNTLPQFIADIEGQPIHFFHVRSSEPDALPLIITHGFPSSNVEFLKLIGPLTDPRAYGGDPKDAFHVVVPSLPGYGFSMPLREPNWTISRIARVWAELMKQLGYERYGAQGTDIGSGVTGMLPSVDSEQVIATHVNSDEMAIALLGFLAHDVPGLSEAEQARLDRLRQYGADGKGYLEIQGTRPQTLSYGLVDSPVAQLAWIAEKFKEWTDPNSTLPEGVDRDQMLTNVSIYWFTGCGASAANFLFEARHAPREWGAPSQKPAGLAAFGKDNILRRFLDPENKNPYWSEFDRGGHFPAMEAPDLLTSDIRAFFRHWR